MTILQLCANSLKDFQRVALRSSEMGERERDLLDEQIVQQFKSGARFRALRFFLGGGGGSSVRPSTGGQWHCHLMCSAYLLVNFKSSCFYC